jgi:quercetin dioxygenase-like cupin family protein
MNANARRSEIVRRTEIPAIHTVTVDGHEHLLGILKEFKKDDRLWSFLPKDSRIAMAWVHLDPGQTLEGHVHPVDSMILISQGQGKCFGDVEAEMSEGDILLVPAGCHHGFTGAGRDGFWGISIQLDSRGLYENLQDPWASFTEGAVRRAIEPKDVLTSLLARNEEFVDGFSRHRLFTVVERGALEDTKARSRFLDCLQVWSNHFQRMLRLRAALSHEGPFGALAERHLNEEFNHHRDLEGMGEDRQTIWDPILEATCSWFPSQMAILDDVEKVVLAHLVVEAAATIFYRNVTPHMKAARGNHFRKHVGADELHVGMGIAVLRQTSLGEAERLFRVQTTGWQMLSSMLGRIADLVAR